MTQSIIFRATFVVILALYPFIIYFGIRVLPPSFFGFALAVLLLIRFGFVRPEERASALPALVLLLAYAVTTAVLGSTRMLLYYPALVNFLLCALFASSLRQDEPLLLRIMRARGITMHARIPPYLARLTAVWAVFLALNGTIAVWTTTASIEIWTIYNGIISYALIAALVLGEWLYRRHYKRKHGIPGE